MDYIRLLDGLLGRFLSRGQREEAEYKIEKIEAGSLETMFNKAMENGIDIFDPKESNGYVKNNSALIEKQLSLVNPNFSAKEFIRWAQRIFTDLCRAESWNDLNDEIKPFVEKDFDFSSVGLKDSFGFSVSYLHLYQRVGDNEILQAYLSTLNQGQSDDRKARRFFMRFKRPSQFKIVDMRRVKTTACPNCGAPVFFSRGNTEQCGYCGQYVTFEEYGWLLAQAEEITADAQINNGEII